MSPVRIFQVSEECDRSRTPVLVIRICEPFARQDKAEVVPMNKDLPAHQNGR